MGNDLELALYHTTATVCNSNRQKSQGQNCPG
jgi:hypothetical protein